MLKFLYRLIREVDSVILLKFIWNFCFKGACAVKKFERRKKSGKHFPAFMVISLTNKCNLSCQGCWVATKGQTAQISPEALNNIILSCKKNGSYYFGLLGGEPLLYDELFSVIAKHPDCYFQIFTNGTLLTRDVAKKMRKLKNVTPLISIEGDEVVSDIRRGGEEVYSRSLQALDNCAKERLLFGVATSVCKSNFNTLVTKKFIDELIKKKAHYLWYYIYRPVGANPNVDLALSKEEITELRKFIVERRCSESIAIIDAYWDADGNALCPGAMGLSHHINMYGDIEFCPPLQFSRDKISQDGSNLEKILEESEFLEKFRKFVTNETPGCIILNNPKKLKEFLESENAKDCSGRNCGYSELEAMKVLPCHHQKADIIPEKSFLYRRAKKSFFFGFGAYG